MSENELDRGCNWTTSPSEHVGTGNLERIFADAWQRASEEATTLSGKSLLRIILENPKDGIVDGRDRAIAASVIQWLGSGVGFYWLVQTLSEAGFSVIPTAQLQKGKTS